MIVERICKGFALCIQGSHAASRLCNAEAKGMFVLVDACDRVQEADTILDCKAGHIRTRYFTGLPA